MIEGLFWMRFLAPVVWRLAFAAAIGLGMASTASAASGRLTLESGGVRRSAFIVEHARLKRARRPVIIFLHGQSGAGVRVRDRLGLDRKIKSRSVVVAYPDALGGRWDVSEAGAERELRFVNDLIARLKKDGIADPKRIFIAGGGPGGILAMRLACRETGTFAGAASLIALMPTADAAACKPSRPIPFMLLAGTADPKIPFGGGKADIPEYKGEVVSAAGTLAPFAAAAACGDKTTKIDVADRDRNDGSRVQLEFRVGCKAPIELVRIDGGGHTLPGARARADRGQPVGARNGDIDTARVLVDFFLKGRGG
ncbi:MAG: phospholipase [Methylobacteriaceae bacterium]|nr:phospholipase [Rhodoblastus sp.]MCC0004484.1 phospholipase [Methylobacteriaceae bacterium]